MTIDDLPVQHFFGAGTYVKETRIPASLVLVQHKHAHDHLSILASGRARVTIDGELKVFDAPACIQIKAGQHHSVLAITDAVWYCIHASGIVDASQIDDSLILPMNPDEMRALALKQVT